ncbi:MAG: hypothetical protein FJ102_26445 [Deltaproteobacteria bacterium]|nr:hypothetical protein [Deltaproteobacteria bacterium]
MDAWIAAGGDPQKLAFYRSFMEVTPLSDTSGRALVFHHGTIGDFTGGPALLAEAESRLRALGCREAVGPLDGNTFFAYRCVVGGGTPLPLEPTARPEPWRRAGYREDARFVSVFAPNSERVCRDRGLPDGWTLRNFDPARFDEELAAMYRVTLSAFAAAWRYAPIPYTAFHAQYAAFRGRVDPRWVWVVDDPHGVTQGYFFTLVAGSVVIAKTIALHASAHGRGISWSMIAAMHRQARDAGLDGAIHHLMHEDAVSNAFAGEGGRVVRRYALYRKRL